ncbi:hypothetical protein TNCV_663701 [Trichonephila clavipes]|nr:hypothetical protein TNCV_663701 [Trichonephila clavipes]
MTTLLPLHSGRGSKVATTISLDKSCFSQTDSSEKQLCRLDLVDDNIDSCPQKEIHHFNTRYRLTKLILNMAGSKEKLQNRSTMDRMPFILDF